jgi:hypothetical protein
MRCLDRMISSVISHCKALERRPVMRERMREESLFKFPVQFHRSVNLSDSFTEDNRKSPCIL